MHRRPFAWRVLLAACALLGGTTPLAAQGATGSVTGTVTSRDTRAPILEARVVVLGTAIEVSTNANGEFRIPAVRAGRAQLSVFKVGYRASTDTVTVTAGQTATLNLSMAASLTQLTDVVVTGTAGNQERRAQAAVVTTVDIADVAKSSPAQNFGQLLQSRVPSVSVNSASGTAGTSRRINIRGAASVNLSNQPLIFVDGVRVVEGGQDLGAGGQRSDRLNNLNPEDIESIEVVKGPAAATLYGADASAGVIQVITKKGRIGATRFQQSLSVDVGEMDQNWTPPANYAFCTAASIAPTSTNPLCRGQTTTTLVSDNPLEREGAFRQGSIRNYGYTARGGGQNYGYFLSANWDEQGGTLPNNDFNRYSWRSNFNFLPDPRLTINASIGINQAQVLAPINDNNIYGYLGGGLLGTPLTRTDDGSGSDGWFGFERDVPAIKAIENEIVTRGTTVGVTAQFLPYSWWSNKLTVGGDLQRDEQTQYFPKNSRGSYAGLLNTGSNFQGRTSNDRYTIDFQSNLRKNFGRDQQWEINATGGLQIVSTRTEFITVTGQGFVTNSNNVPSSASQTSGTGQETDVRQRGWIGQAQLGHRDRRFLQVGVRVDEFSVFGENVDPAVLPKIGGSWVVSDEPFFSGLTGIFNQLRLRAAWGQTGRAPGAGAALTTLASTPSAVITGTTATVESGAVPQNPGNADLKPERGTEIELGFDASFFRDRLAVEVTYFDKKTNDLILAQPQPPSLGFTQNPLVNIGEVVNRGFEVTVSATPIQRSRFSWDIRGGFSTLHNELTDLGGVAPFNTLNRFTEGYQLGSFVSQRIRSIDEATGVVTVADTFEVVGNTFPTFEATVTNTFTFFNQVRVNAQIDTKRDFLLYNNTDFFRETQLVRSNRRLDTLLLSRRERLRRYGNPTPGRPAFVTASGASRTVNEVRDAFLQPGDFVRFRELGVTWDVPRKLLGYARGIEAMSIGLAVQNVKLWKDKNFDGPDPEVISAAVGQFNRDDFLTLPNPRTTVLRFNLSF